MADRLRAESEQALAQLQENHRALEHQFAQALRRQAETERQLEILRAEHREASGKLTRVTQQEQQRAELDALRNSLKDAGDEQPERQACGEARMKHVQTEATNAENRNDVNDANLEAGAAADDDDVQEGDEARAGQLIGRGVAEGYLRSLAALEEKNGRQKTPRRIVRLSERSW